MIVILTSTGFLFKYSAICLIIVSAKNIPCGPPKPRNAVLDGILVLHIKPYTSDTGIL